MNHKILKHISSTRNNPVISVQQARIVNADELGSKFENSLSNLYHLNNGHVINLNIDAPIDLTGKIIEWYKGYDVNGVMDGQPIVDDATFYEYFELSKET